MATLERAIYTITYYWHGIPRDIVMNVLWLYDKLHHLELVQWSKVNGLPYNQVVKDKINVMIVNGHLRMVNRWSRKFQISGLEPIQKNNTLKVFKGSQKFSKRFRMVIDYYINHPKRFRTYFNNRFPKGIATKIFYERILDTIR